MNIFLYILYCIGIICVDGHITRDSWMISRHIDPDFMHTKAMHSRAKAVRV